MDKLIICNWKMNGNMALVDAFLDSFNNENLIMAFPSIFIAYARFRNKSIKLAAQDCSTYNNFGANTGEISAKMLRGVGGVEYVIVGHSERRSSQLDSVQTVYEKLKNIIQNNMVAILCVAENYEQLLDKKTVELLRDNLDKVILAYEPLTAIGTGVIPMVGEIQNAIRNIKRKYFNLKTVYGGSVNSKNAKEMLSINDLSGLLIGGASLKIDEIKGILNLFPNNEIIY